MARKPTLAEFAGAYGGRRTVKWCDSLPDEVKQEMLESDASTQIVVKWLQALGYDEASYGKVDGWRRGQRERRIAG